MTAKIKSYPVAEASKLLGVSQATLYRLFAAKQLKRTKVRGRTVIRETELERFLERQTR